MVWWALECFCSESSMYASRLAITLVSATTYSKPKSLRPLYNSPPWRYVWTIFFKILTPKKMHEISGFTYWNNSCAWTTCPTGIVDGSYENWHAWQNFETQKLGWVTSREGQFWKNPAWTIKNHGFFRWNNCCAWSTCPTGIVDGSYVNWHAWQNFKTQKLGWVNSREGQFWKKKQPEP